MKPQYHAEITIQALQDIFSKDALKEIIHANSGQDALQYQINHPHFHFDESAFKEGFAYVDEQRWLTLAALRHAEPGRARAAFGRAIHALQDFYAHSNYVSLWQLGNPQAGSQEIDPQVEDLLASDQLISGKLYYPLEIFSFIPLTEPLVLRLLPCDSHALMNKDYPGRPGFEFAYWAAVKRTRQFYVALADELDEPSKVIFTNH